MTPDEENRPPDRADHPEEPAEGGREEGDAALDDTVSDAEGEGVVQQDATQTPLEENVDDDLGDDPMAGEAPTG